MEGLFNLIGKAFLHELKIKVKVMVETVEKKQKVLDVQNIYTFTVFPDSLNYGGTLFGGKLLAEMDSAAANSGRRLMYDTECNGMVTAHLSEVDFLNPAHLGDIVELNTTIVKMGRTSVTIKVVAKSENLMGEKRLICKAQFVMVGLKDGTPYPHGKSII